MHFQQTMALALNSIVADLELVYMQRQDLRFCNYSLCNQRIYISCWEKPAKPLFYLNTLVDRLETNREQFPLNFVYFCIKRFNMHKLILPWYLSDQQPIPWSHLCCFFLGKTLPATYRCPDLALVLCFIVRETLNFRHQGLEAYKTHWDQRKYDIKENIWFVRCIFENGKC